MRHPEAAVALKAGVPLAPAGQLRIATEAAIQREPVGVDEADRARQHVDGVTATSTTGWRCDQKPGHDSDHRHGDFATWPRSAAKAAGKQPERA